MNLYKDPSHENFKSLRITFKFLTLTVIPRLSFSPISIV